MVQPTLDQYFHPFRTPASGVTFLDLPFTLRRRIYLKAGLLSKSTIYLNYIPSSGDHCDIEYGGDLEQWPVEETISARSFSLSHFLDGYLPWPQICLNRHCLCLEQQTSNNPRCNCNALPYQLLYVSKAVAKEVFTIFYSENDFRVYRTGLGGLSSLSRLPPKALAHVKSLSICLNFYDEQNRWSRDFGPDSGGYCHAACGMSKLEILLSSAKRHHEHAVLREWQKLCKLLRSEIQPSYLKLFLVCDVADVEIAEEIVQPLLQLPTLQECALRLGSHYLRTGIDCSQPLTELARRTIDKVTARSVQRNFRYQDLPKEIRTRILGFTELVTPYDLVWAFNTGVARQIKSLYYEYRTFFSDCSAWTSSLCCQNCSPDSEPCACWSGQAAFSTTCTCWKFPLSLFLVDRGMRKDAEFIFYSRNHFLLLPRRWNNSKHLEIYNFLKHLPRNGRRYIRAITWTLSDLHQGGGYLEPNHPTYSEWSAAIFILAHDVLPGQLSLTIDPQFDLESILWSHGSEYMDVPDDCGTAEAEHIWVVCERVVDSLSRNNHLRNLFIHFVWPFEKHKDGMPRDRGAVLEKRVLGEGFDGRARGKFDRRCRWNKYRCNLNEEGTCVVCQSR